MICSKDSADKLPLTSKEEYLLVFQAKELLHVDAEALFTINLTIIVAKL